MMRPPRSTLASLLAVMLVLVICPTAAAAPPTVGRQTGHPVKAAAPATHAQRHTSAFCEVAGPVIGAVLPAVGQLVGASPGVCEAAGEAVGGLAGEAAGAIGSSVMDGVATWMIGAATQVTGFVTAAMAQTTTPQLSSAWYERQFAPMADLGAALGLLVALIALASAALRRSPQALAATVAGIFRAGLGTALVVPLTVIALQVCDEISAAVLSGSTHTFWATAAHAWGTNGFGGFGSSALALLIALVEALAGLVVLLELVVRGAAIYVAVLFFPVVLAASIWPALQGWTGRLGRLLLLFIVLKPVALIVLGLAGGAAAAGLSFGAGVPASVGTILAAVVIFALAACAPWGLMYLLAADAESAYTSAGLRSTTGAALGDRNGRSLRTAGGLRNLRLPKASSSGGRGAQ